MRKYDKGRKVNTRNEWITVTKKIIEAGNWVGGKFRSNRKKTVSVM